MAGLGPLRGQASVAPHHGGNRRPGLGRGGGGSLSGHPQASGGNPRLGRRVDGPTSSRGRSGHARAPEHRGDGRHCGFGASWGGLGGLPRKTRAGDHDRRAGRCSDSVVAWSPLSLVWVSSGSSDDRPTVRRKLFLPSVGSVTTSELRSRARVNGEMWTAGSYGGNHRGEPFWGIIRCQGSPRWRGCQDHLHPRGHKTSDAARECAKIALTNIVRSPWTTSRSP